MGEGVFLSLKATLPARPKVQLGAMRLREAAPLVEAIGIGEGGSMLGGEVSVQAKTLEQALAKLEAQGLEVERESVASSEVVIEEGKPWVRILTAGDVGRDPTVDELLAHADKLASSGERYFDVTRGKGELTLLGYLDDFDDYEGWVHPIALLCGCVALAGGKVRCAMVADDELLEPDVYRGIKGERGALRMTELSVDDAQAAFSRFFKAYGVDLEALAEGRARYLARHAGKAAKVRRAHNYGFVDASGGAVTEAIFAEARQFFGGRAAVRDASYLWGFVDEGGKLVVPTTFVDVGDFSEGLCAARAVTSRKKVRGGGEQTTERYGYIDERGAMAIAPAFDDAGPFRGGRARVQKGERWGYIDRSGAQVIAARYGFASDFADGLAVVSLGGAYDEKPCWYVDGAGEAVFADRFDGAGLFFEGHTLIRRGELWGYLDRQGRVVVEPRYAQADYLRGGTALVYDGRGWGVIDATGRQIVPCKHTLVERAGEVFVATRGRGGAVVLAGDGREIARGEAVGEVGEGLVPIREKGKWGYVTVSGDRAIEARYAQASGFGEGVAVVREGARRFSMIDRTGAVVGDLSAVLCDGDELSRFAKNGLATVKRRGLYGLLHRSGRMLLEPSLDEVVGHGEPIVLVKYA